MTPGHRYRRTATFVPADRLRGTTAPAPTVCTVPSEMTTQTSGTRRTRARGNRRPAPETTTTTNASRSHSATPRAPRRGPGHVTPTGPTITATGTVRIHTRGFAFIDLDPTTDGSPAAASCFVPPPLVTDLLNEDRVTLTYVLEHDGRGTVTDLTRTARPRTTLYGTIEDDGHGGRQLRPDPHVGRDPWPIDGPAAVGHAALCDITGSRATVRTAFPDPHAAAALREMVLQRHNITPAYPADVLAELPNLTWGSDVRRRDLRHLPTITVDSDSSRDLDDALSVHPADADGGLWVLVHIADVAAHLPAGCATDAEARRTGTSVYLPGWNRPMLPPALSEDALSLLPGVDRDALTVEMRIDSDGVITAADVYASLIRSDTRLNYETTSDILAGQRPDGVDDVIIDTVRWLRTAGARLGVQRMRRGGIEARRVEPELTVQVIDGAATQVTAEPSNPANVLIERLMVAANESVGQWLLARGLPGMFRTHPEPGSKASATLETFCAAAGYHPGFGPRLTPLGLAALSSQLDTAADATATAVWDVLLKYLGRAEYTPTAGLHFGLASGSYLHFTSPIRRYADVTVHRIVHAFLDGARTVDVIGDHAALTGLAQHLNEASGVAARAESQMRKALWMVTLSKEPAGKVRHGRVTGLNAKGVFITLEQSLISGFLPARDLPGTGWELTEDELSLRSATGDVLSFGQNVSVKVKSIDVAAGQLELRPAGTRGTRR